MTKIDRSPDAPFSDVLAQPRAHLDRSREVLLVWRNEPVQEEEKPVEDTVETESTPAEEKEKESTLRRGNRE